MYNEIVESLKKLLGLGPSVNYLQLIGEGAMILDVRTPAEFKEGHITGALNIPVEELRANLHRLTNKRGAIIACCTNGAKSWYAKNLLDATGYELVYDAGSWVKLQRRILAQ